MVIAKALVIIGHPVDHRVSRMTDVSLVAGLCRQQRPTDPVRRVQPLGFLYALEQHHRAIRMVAHDALHLPSRYPDGRSRRSPPDGTTPRARPPGYRRGETTEGPEENGSVSGYGWYLILGSRPIVLKKAFLIAKIYFSILKRPLPSRSIPQPAGKDDWFVLTIRLTASCTRSTAGSCPRPNAHIGS